MSLTINSNDGFYTEKVPVLQNREKLTVVNKGEIAIHQNVHTLRIIFDELFKLNH